MKKESDNLTMDLFEQPVFGTNPHKLVRRQDPDTSHEAAKKVKTADLERLVYEVIRMFPNGCTSDQVMKCLPNHGVQTISPRYAPLMRKGLIEDTGERRVASSGRNQRVMKAKETA